MKLKKMTFVMSICSLMMMFTSCDTAMAVLAGMAEGASGYGTNGTTLGYGAYGTGTPYVPASMIPNTSNFVPTSGVVTSYPSYTSSSYPSTYTESTSTNRTCQRCHGSGLCQTCKGQGTVYDWGTCSVVSKGKYTHKCRVCNGSGKCGACH